MLDLQEGILREFAERVVRFSKSQATIAGLTLRNPNLDSRDTQKSRNSFRSAAKLCHKCGSPTSSGTLCDLHKQSHRDREKARFLARKLAGICKSCPELATNGIRCISCAEKKRLTSKATKGINGTGTDQYN